MAVSSVKCNEPAVILVGIEIYHLMVVVIPSVNQGNS